MTAAARVVVVGGELDAPHDPEGAAVALALGAAGIPVASRSVVDADETACEEALASGGALTIVVADSAGAEADLIRRVLARATGGRLVLNERMLASLEERHRRMDRPVPRSAERLALLPQGAVVWETADGDAAWAVDGETETFVVLPRGGGVAEALEHHVVPLARARLAAAGAVAVRTLKIVGVSIGEVEERLVKPVASLPEDVSVAVVPAEGEVWVRLRARSATPERAARALAEVEGPVVAALGQDCYGRDAESLERIVGRLLLDRGLMLSVAESCTGGLVGHRLTDVGGASAYFERGVVVYSNRAKQELLGVPESILRTHGAVSGPCAEAMVRGICERTESACGLAITGIAGPDGGTPTKPVGTVFIGVAVPGDVRAHQFQFGGDRHSVKWQAAQTALDLLRRRLQDG